MDEKLENRLFFKTTKNVYSGELLPPDSDDFTSMDNLFNYQAKVIKELAQTESYVIIGRCADYILKDFPNVIRIFVHAPMDFCIENMRALHSLSDRELEKLIRKTDKYRADYYAYHTGRSWQDARNFDLCLNSKDLGFEKCIRLVKEYVNIKLEL